MIIAVVLEEADTDRRKWRQDKQHARGNQQTLHGVTRPSQCFSSFIRSPRTRTL
jgi:hypothetical protein